MPRVMHEQWGRVVRKASFHHCVDLTERPYTNEEDDNITGGHNLTDHWCACLCC